MHNILLALTIQSAQAAPVSAMTAEVEIPQSDSVFLRCPEEFEAVDKTCVKSGVSEAIIECEEGTLKDGICLSTYRAEASCLEGELLDGVCKSRKRVPKVKVRKHPGLKADLIDGTDGTDIDAAFGIDKQEPASEFICEEGELDATGKYCVITETVSTIPKLYCLGGKLDDKGCKNEIPLEVIPVCDSGLYDEKEEACSIKSIKAPEIIEGECAEGFEEGEDGLCSQEVPGESYMGCPADAEEVEGGKCLLVSETLPTYSPVCPTGFEDAGGVCSKLITGEIEESCPKNAKKTAEGCQLTTMAPADVTLSCPEGFEEEQGKKMCFKLEEYDCSEPAETGKEHHNVRGTTSRVITKMCEKKISIAKIATSACPEGFETGPKNTCIKSEVVDPLQKCSLEYGSVDACETTEYAPISNEPTCEEGTEPSADGFACVSSEPADPIEVCTLTGEAFDDTCVSVQSATKSRSISCPAGYSISHDACIKSDNIEPHFVCEDPRFDAEHCYLMEYTMPLQRDVCPLGAIRSSLEGECLFRYTIEAKPAATELDEAAIDGDASLDGDLPSDGDQAAVEPEVEMTCPLYPNIVEEDGGCFLEKVTAPELRCKGNSILNNGVCQQVMKPRQRCNVGSSLIDGKCLGKEYAVPTVVFVRECQGKGCEDQFL